MDVNRTRKRYSDHVTKMYLPVRSFECEITVHGVSTHSFHEKTVVFPRAPQISLETGVVQQILALTRSHHEHEEEDNVSHFDHT